MATEAARTPCCGVCSDCHRYGSYSSTISSGSVKAQPGPQTMPRDASSPAKTALAWGGPPMTANGCFSAMAMASARAASTSSLAPVPVAGGVLFAQVTAGGDHTCGRAAGGTAFCWGENRWGQLGDGTLDSRVTPTAVVQPF